MTTTYRVVVGSDDAGYDYKEALKADLMKDDRVSLVTDVGVDADSHTDYPDIAVTAARMIADHEGVNKQAVALATKLKVTPQDNDTSKALKAGGDKNIATLKTLNGAAFDKAYVDQEVAYHQAVLDAIDKTLAPNASDAELKTLIVKVRPAIAAHLEHARHIQSTLGK